MGDEGASSSLLRRVWGSIAGRLLLGAAVWSILVLAVAGAYVMALYRAETIRLLDEDLTATIQTLTAAVDSDQSGEIVANDAAFPNDPRFTRVLSGWYWAFLSLDEDNRITEPLPSRSLWDEEPPIDQSMIDEAVNGLGAIIFRDGTGPTGEPVRVALRAILLPDREAPIGVYAAIDLQAADTSAERLRTRLFLALAVLALGLFLAVFLQVRIGLAPVRQIRRSLSDIRAGRKTQLTGPYPLELTPLAQEMNTLIDHNKDVVERARTHVGNLAHALKTPIAILINESDGEDDRAKLIRRQAEAMSQNVNHYLQRAQAAARAEVLGARTEIAPAVDDLARLLKRLHRDKALQIEVDIDPGAVFRGERQDLDDLIGNLMDNAAKWGRSTISVTARKTGAGVRICVDDDGPGLREEDRAAAMERGRRLDESEPGTGLGLSIVKELAELYGGAFALEDSRLGGLSARLDLPAATS
ncbi:MAG: sensor histidine kinase [Pseudomonadota bacterium]